MDILIVIFFLIILMNIRIDKYGENDPLDIKYNKSIKGILAVLIIFSHIQYNRTDLSIFHLFNYIGDFLVGMFFFYSGYGLMIQSKKDGSYNKRLLKKRILPLIEKYLIANIIYLIYYVIVGEIFNYGSFLKFSENFNLLVSHSWYIIVIIFLYCFFYLAGLLLKHNYRAELIVITLLSFACILVFGVLGIPVYWYNSILCFSFGIFIALNSKVIKEKNWLIFISSLICFAFLSYFQLKNNFDGKIKIYLVPIIKNISIIIFCYCFNICSKYLNFKGDFFIKASKISLELYLYHGLFEKIYSNIIYIKDSNLLYGILVLVSTIIISIIMNTMFRKIKES